MATDTRRALLASAERAARRAGYDGFSYGDLAQDVGIRKASIHYHFPTKAALTADLVAQYSARIQQRLAGIDAAQTTGAARLAALVALYRAALDQGHSLCLCVALSISADTLPDTVRHEIQSFRAYVTAWIARGFALGVVDGSLDLLDDPGTEAAALLAQLEGAQLAARAARSPAPFDAALRGFVQRTETG